MSDLTAVRHGLADALGSIPGLRGYPVMVNAPPLPAACVNVRSFSYAQSFDDLTLFRFVVWVYVNASDLARAQAAIDEYLAADSPTSIKAAVEADPTLGGVAQYVIVTGITEGPRLVDAGGVQPLACPIDVEVMA